MMGSENYDYLENDTDGLGGNGDFMTSAGASSSSSSPCRFFEHSVCKLDTLAGVAIKYGVEVADIKRMNNLVTDHQMFALKTLRIPLPGRHPPSLSLSNGCSTVTARHTVSAKTPPRRILPDILDSFESLKATPEKNVSPAMSSLQGYYGLGLAHPRRTQSEGFEMALLPVCNKESAGSLENGSLRKPSGGAKPPLSIGGKCRSLANVFNTDEEEMGNHVQHLESSDTDSDKPVRQRQKSETDFTSHTPDKISKEDNGIGGWFATITAKSLALRTKASSRNNLASESSNSNVADGLLGVRKSSSTPTLQDQDCNSSTSIWPGSWNLKPDLQALSNSAIAKPILDGWANPITGRKNKTALD